MRRHFQLPPGDQEYLDGLELPWEALCEGQTMWLFIHDWRVPAGYKQNSVLVALLIPPGYPDTQIDMAYFFPALELQSNRQLGGIVATPTVDGKLLQRWSRHRTAANPWRPGLDDLSTHMSLVRYWLEREMPEASVA